VLFKKLDSDSSGCQRLHEVEKVAEIPCEPIHAVHDDCVVESDELEQRFKLRALRITSGGLVNERTLDQDSVELAVRMLIR
jgi:hypothetical protein